MVLFLLLCGFLLTGIIATAFLLRKDMVGEDPVEKEKYRQFRVESELRDTFRSDEDFYKHGI